MSASELSPGALSACIDHGFFQAQHGSSWIWPLTCRAGAGRWEDDDGHGGADGAHAGEWSPGASRARGAAAEDRRAAGPAEGAEQGLRLGHGQGWQARLADLAGEAARAAVGELEGAYSGMVAALEAEERRVQAAAPRLAELRSEIARLAASG